MKYLIMTEGECEKALIDLLINRGLTFISNSDLIYEETYHLRQIPSTFYERIDHAYV